MRAGSVAQLRLTLCCEKLDFHSPAPHRDLGGEGRGIPVPSLKARCWSLLPPPPTALGLKLLDAGRRPGGSFHGCPPETVRRRVRMAAAGDSPAQTLKELGGEIGLPDPFAGIWVITI